MAESVSRQLKKVSLRASSVFQAFEAQASAASRQPRHDVASINSTRTESARMDRPKVTTIMIRELAKEVVSRRSAVTEKP